jgi:hypothetical protein
MTSRSRPRSQNRIRLRIPRLVELGGEDLAAVLGSLVLAALIVGGVLVDITPSP